MRLALASYHAPRQEGSAGGRQLWALGQALQELGHEVSALCWQPQEPLDLADWAQWRRIPDLPRWQVRGQALLRPRTDARALRWDPPSDAVLLADDPLAFGAAVDRPAATSVHYAVRLDRAAQHDWSLHHVQDLRAERRAVRRATAVLALSERVRDAVGRGMVVPATVPLPATVVAPLDRPVVGLLADWSWAPNLTAADALLAAWPDVRSRVPGAELLLAGRGEAPVRSLTGVRWLGEVPRAADLLSQVSVLAFPCPATSGPKMKTLDALAHGVPVVTTTGGAEGVRPSSGLLVSSREGIADRLVALLQDPEERARMAVAAREVMERYHSPLVAAQARVDALSA